MLSLALSFSLLLSLALFLLFLPFFRTEISLQPVEEETNAADGVDAVFVEGADELSVLVIAGTTSKKVSKIEANPIFFPPFLIYYFLILFFCYYVTIAITLFITFHPFVFPFVFR